jgi:hypothetical protein
VLSLEQIFAMHVIGFRREFSDSEPASLPSSTHSAHCGPVSSWYGLG